MIVFWLICAGLTVVALLFIFPPLLQVAEKNNDAEVREANLSVYRDQLRELEADMRNGITSKEQYELDREEIERRLLADVANDKHSAPAARTGPSARNLAYVLALVLPTAAVLLYLKVGTRKAMSASPSVSMAAPTGAASASGEMSQERIEANVAALEKRLEQTPNDGPGWSMLARSYSSLGRYKEASAAFEKASAISPNDADLLTDYAYALSMARGQEMEGKPTELLKQALKVDPQNLKALVLAGNAAFKANNYDQAVEYWQKVLPSLPPNSAIRESLSERISEAKRLAKTTPSK